eukprot:948932-Prymnesium_polylepis.2
MLTRMRGSTRPPAAPAPLPPACVGVTDARRPRQKDSSSPAVCPPVLPRSKIGSVADPKGRNQRSI